MARRAVDPGVPSGCKSNPKAQEAMRWGPWAAVWLAALSLAVAAVAEHDGLKPRLPDGA